MLHDRRKAGRPRNVNRPPSNAHIATTKETINELDRLVNFQKMPIGQKLEHLIREIQYNRKNWVGQLQISQPNELSVCNNVYNNSTNELSVEEYNRVWKEFDNDPSEEGIIQE